MVFHENIRLIKGVIKNFTLVFLTNRYINKTKIYCCEFSCTTTLLMICFLINVKGQQIQEISSYAYQADPLRPPIQLLLLIWTIYQAGTSSGDRVYAEALNVKIILAQLACYHPESAGSMIRCVRVCDQYHPTRDYPSPSQFN